MIADLAKKGLIRAELTVHGVARGSDAFALCRVSAVSRACADHQFAGQYAAETVIGCP
jgi:hypothetical protein